MLWPKIYKIYIGGRWGKGGSGQTKDVINPSTGKSIGRLCIADQHDLERALVSATQGLSVWSATPECERGTILKDAASLMRERNASIGRMMTLEHGKTLAESRMELIRAADFIEWGGEGARRISSRIFTARDPQANVVIDYGPIGVVAAFSPWNYPVMQASKKTSSTARSRLLMCY